jgi:hypothetical protein
MHATNNVAKNGINFSISIARERLRPQYGDGFAGAPLAASPAKEQALVPDRGVAQDESQRSKNETVDSPADI